MGNLRFQDNLIMKIRIGIKNQDKCIFQIIDQFFNIDHINLTRLSRLMNILIFSDRHL